jgi:hypothetical protein
MGVEKELDKLGKDRASLVVDCMEVIIILKWLESEKSNEEDLKLYAKALRVSYELFSTYSKGVS